MKLKALDIVVLRYDLPEHDMHEGELGAVVDVYEPNAIEVEFVEASGRTKALLTLDVSAVRALNDAA
ncbi:MAG: DUF4926 domain-containing protein [Planctomycetota bacterium]